MGHILKIQPVFKEMIWGGHKLRDIYGYDTVSYTHLDELTQKDVAEVLGISQSYISRLEKKIIKKLRNKLNDDE